MTIDGQHLKCMFLKKINIYLYTNLLKSISSDNKSSLAN